MEVKKNDPLDSAGPLVRRWTAKWNVPHLAAHVTCEWSPRLTRSLGRAYPKRNLVRLNKRILTPESRMYFEEVLCHELAHIAVYVLHGPNAVSHGPEWKRLIEQVGFPARRGIIIPGDNSVVPSVRYEHRCPICQAKRFAERPQSNWRCVVCRLDGLGGELEIRSIPSAREHS